REMDEKGLEELTEKFIRQFQNILTKTKLSSIEKLPYMTMIKELLINLPDRQKIEKNIDEETKKNIKNQQEEYYLREKLKEIKKKLGDNEGDKEMKKYLEQLEKEPYPEHTKKVVKEEIKRYETMPIYSSEANIIRQQKLNEKHYGLKEVKERIIEYLAVNQIAKKPLGQIICLVGPPGIGKTSLAISIAEVTGRKFVRISLGGVRDVAVIQGHRRTYIGAMPGRIIQGMKEAKVIDPLFLIDEIDKISSDYHGDPFHALLEVLDINLNKEFTDHYLGIPYNLSQVMFICTANSVADLPRPLLDRMEVIFLHSYTEIEKFHIATEHLIPENLENYNLPAAPVFQDQAVRDIIKYYTREAGVRELNRKIQTIIQKFIVQLMEKKKEKLIITPHNLIDYLKKKNYDFTQKQKRSQVGVATEGELELTGNLGDIMKESAHIALNYVRANHKKFGISSEVFSQSGVHIHVPEGATPKEGPSAGIALTSAIISVLTGRSISRDLGMTGEITLHGHVGEIGGLKEKAIAARRSELKTIIIPKANEKDIEDIPLEVRQELKIIPVEEYREHIQAEYQEGADYRFVGEKQFEKHGTANIRILSPSLKKICREKFNFPLGVNDCLDYEKIDNEESDFFYRVHNFDGD
ncbi:611_t:CDS:2, partial [Ambispora gerdemannii]